jgi:hypothetical protein
MHSQRRKKATSKPTLLVFRHPHSASASCFRPARHILIRPNKRWEQTTFLFLTFPPLSQSQTPELSSLSGKPPSTLPPFHDPKVKSWSFLFLTSLPLSQSQILELSFPYRPRSNPGAFFSLPPFHFPKFKPWSFLFLNSLPLSQIQTLELSILYLPSTFPKSNPGARARVCASYGFMSMKWPSPYNSMASARASAHSHLQKCNRNFFLSFLLVVSVARESFIRGRWVELGAQGDGRPVGRDVNIVVAANHVGSRYLILSEFAAS